VKLKFLAAPAAALLLAGSVAGCSGASAKSKTVEASAQNGHLTIGISFDRPGLGIKSPDGTFKGFDVDVAKYVASKLGVQESSITWKEATPAQRECLIQIGQVYYVVNSYSINDSRK
jgi:glutamate transport system substrate-binding protein